MIQRLTATFLFSLTTILLSAQTINGTIQHDGITRDYILHLPSGYDASQSYPFVYNLHGFTSNASQQQFYTRMDATADANGFIVCYPNGVDASWNVGWSFGSTADDVGFLVDLVDALAEEYSIDSDRLYSCGMSNGGFMSYKLACEQSGKFAAIASVTGSMVPSELTACDPVRQMPVMQIHGTADPTVAYGGSFISAPVEDVVNYWVDRDGCVLMADTIAVEDINIFDGCAAERIEYTDCENDNEVVFYKIEGGGHTWPDGALSIGVTNRDFDGSQEIWNFFSRFDLNGAIVSSNVNVGQESTISLSPNPAYSHVTLSDVPFDVEKISIVDALGDKVYAQDGSQESIIRLNVDQLAIGVYFVIVEGESYYEVVRFLKL